MSEGAPHLLPPLVPVRTVEKWLSEIFPEGTAHRNYVIREMAAKTIFVMLYTGAVEGSDRWFRPAQATLMTNAQSRKTEPSAREQWRVESLKKGKLQNSAASWYAPNSREPIRDETLRSGLILLGAVIEKSGVPTTSQSPRYALRKDFSDLLIGLAAGRMGPADIERWQRTHLTAEALARVTLLKKGAAAAKGGARITITFPNGERRLMPQSPSALLTRSVIEIFAPRFLLEPAVLLVSDSGEKIVARDESLAADIGVRLQISRNLPDVILVDVAAGRERLVFVEVVATDGPVTSARQAALAALAAEARFAAASVFFVTAFSDRSAPAFRKAVAEIAWDSFAWFASEPDNLVCFKANAALTLGT